MDWLTTFNVDNMDHTELRSFMGKMLFSRDDVFKGIDVLSGGEKTRLIIAKLMMQGGNVMVFDEPTNHLDLESIEALNFGISLFKTTVLLVSHDHRFISSLATRIFEVSDDGIVDHLGDLDSFEEWRTAQKRELKRTTGARK